MSASIESQSEEGRLSTLCGMRFVHLARDWSAREINTGGSLLDEVRITDALGHELLVKWRLAEGQVLARLEVEEDSFPSLSGCDELLKLLSRLARENDHISPEVLCFELIRLGVQDATQPCPPGEDSALNTNQLSCGAPEV